MKAAEGELLAHHMSVLLEKEGCGARALLRDERREELALLCVVAGGVALRWRPRVCDEKRAWSGTGYSHESIMGCGIFRASFASMCRTRVRCRWCPGDAPPYTCACPQASPLCGLLRQPHRGHSELPLMGNPLTAFSSVSCSTCTSAALRS